MKKRLTASILVFTMALTLWAGALLQYENFQYVDAVLTFNGTTANCTMEIEANDGVKFNATMTLYRVDGTRDVLLREWGTSATTSLEHSGTHTVTRGQTYKLTVKATGQGETVTKSVTATCP